MADNAVINQPILGDVFLMERSGDDYQCYFIVDDVAFPQHAFFLEPPEPLRLLRNIIILDSVDGILCFFGCDVDANIWRAVMWNLTNLAAEPLVTDVIPNAGYERTIVGFGVSHGDPKLVKISVIANFDGIPTMWDVDVYSSRTREWINVHRGMQPFRSCKMECAKVCVNGVIYFRAYDLRHPRSNFFISFNLENGVFGEVCLPGDLVHTPDYIDVSKVNGSLGLLSYHDGVCDVWTKEEGANDQFNMIRTIALEGQALPGNVLGFRNNGVAVVDQGVDPLIVGNQHQFFMRLL